MRQALSFIVASALLIGGVYLVLFEYFEAAVIRGAILLAAGMMIAAGGAWLVEDFVRPIWRKREGQ